MITITWADGHSDTAAHWAELERKVWDTQWQAAPTKAAFRAELAHRAEVWSQTTINQTGSAEEFFRELARARMLTITPPD